MSFSGASTLPPTLQRSDLHADDLHLLTGIPLDLLAGYAVGRFRPTVENRKALTRVGAITGPMAPLELSAFLDRARFRILRKILPHEEIEKLLDLKDYAAYRSRLASLVKENRAEVGRHVIEATGGSGYVFSRSK